VKNPLFKIGDRVYHNGKNTYGTVVEVFHDSVGIRYYVDHGGFRWSVPEKKLDSDKNKKLLALMKSSTYEGEKS